MPTRPDAWEELYDHRKDERERMNFASKSERRELIQQLSQSIPKTTAPIRRLCSYFSRHSSPAASRAKDNGGD